MLRYILVTFLFFLASMLAAAQSRISVKEETFDDMETTAMVNPEKDRNNRDCALVIFHNVEPDGYYFDAGSVFIKAENHTSRDNGEKTIFLYISEGAKLINIRHRDDGIMSLRYEFANGPLQARHTYHVFLGKVVPANANAKQYLRFKITPPTASLEVEEQSGQFVPWTVNPTTGMAAKALPLGNYAYRVQARQYHPTGGKAEMTDATKPHDEQVTLHPAFGTLQMAVFDGATVSVDGENIVDYTSLRLDPGVHSVKISRPRFKLYQTEVTIEEGKSIRLIPNFEANFSFVRLQASASDVAISLREVDSDRRLGTGSWEGKLEAGDYIIVSSAAGHRESVHTITVPAGARNLDFTLPAPTPVYGSININSDPMGAKVTLDGNPAGETPTILSNVLVGEHLIGVILGDETLANVHTTTVDVKEGETVEVNADMNRATDENLTKANSFEMLPDFIVHPLGYNGLWDFKSRDKTLKALVDYFRTMDSSFQNHANVWGFEYTMSYSQQIGKFEFHYMYMLTLKKNEIIITYGIPNSAVYDELPGILMQLCTNTERSGASGNKVTVKDAQIRGLADGIVDLECNKNKQITTLSVKYHFN